LWTHTRFFLSLRAAFFSSSSNISAIAANCLLENEWGCIFEGKNRRPPNHVLFWKVTEHDGQREYRPIWRKGNVTHSVIQPYSSAYFVTIFILLLFTDYDTAGDDPRLFLFLFVFYLYQVF
jgi:hypothetical protein